MVGIAVVRADDYEELAGFMAAFPDVKVRTPADWRSRLAAWWDLNPAFQEAFPRGWILRDDGRITGFFGSIPLRVQLGGRPATAFGATSWRVLPEYRGKSINLKLRQLAAHKEDVHFATTPREEIVPLLERLGYRQIRRGEGSEFQSQIILDFEEFLRSRYRDLAVKKPIAKLGAPFLDAFQALRVRGLRDSGRADVREIARADQTFDELWQRTRARFANTNVRTAEQVNWYCFAKQPAEKKLFAFFEGGELLGYMILLVKADDDRRLMECVDVWIDPAAGEERVLAGLVAKVAESARDGAFERVLFPHFDSALARLYGRLGLLRGPAWRKREYIKGPRHLMETITADNSYFVRAQGDYGL